MDIMDGEVRNSVVQLKMLNKFVGKHRRILRTDTIKKSLRSAFLSLLFLFENKDVFPDYSDY